MAEQGMVERVALALHGHEESWHDYTWEQLPPEVQADFLGQATAAIAAMREPTEAMLAASAREWDGRMSYRSTGAWQAMLDAALATPEVSGDE